jgi:hypothetical protein
MWADDPDHVAWMHRERERLNREAVFAPPADQRALAEELAE